MSRHVYADNDFNGFNGETGHEHLHNGDQVTYHEAVWVVINNDPSRRIVEARPLDGNGFAELPYDDLG